MSKKDKNAAEKKRHHETVYSVLEILAGDCVGAKSKDEKNELDKITRSYIESSFPLTEPYGMAARNAARMYYDEVKEVVYDRLHRKQKRH